MSKRARGKNRWNSWTDFFWKPVVEIYDPVAKVCYPALEGHWNKKYRHLSWPRLALAFDVFLLFVLGGAVVFWIFSGSLLPRVGAPNLVRLTIGRPASLISGSETSFEVSYKNESDRTLTGAELIVSAPSADFILDQGGEALGRRVIGDLAPGASGTIAYKGRLYGAVGSRDEVKAQLSYWEEGRAEVSKATSRDEWVVAGSVLPVVLETDADMMRGRVGAVRISYSNSGSEVLSARLRLEAPADFVVTGTEPTRVRGEWPVTVAAGGSGTVVAYGYLRGVYSASGSRVPPIFRAVAVSADGSVLSDDRRNANPLASSFALTSDIASSAGTEVVKPGQELTVKIRYQNQGSEDVHGAVISLAADPGPVSADGPMVWNSEMMPALALIRPGESGEVSVKLKVLDGSAAGAAPKLVLAGRAAIFIGEDRARPVIVETAPMEMLVATALEIRAAALYYSASGDQLGRGPLPPRVGETTRYRVFLQLTNGAGSVKGAMVEAILPAHAVWTGKTSVDAGEALDYLPVGRVVRWTVGDLAPGAGHDGEVGASFEVALTPVAADLGRSPALLEDIAVRGVDGATGVQLRARSSDVTTDLAKDAMAKGKGAVVK